MAISRRERLPRSSQRSANATGDSLDLGVSFVLADYDSRGAGDRVALHGAQLAGPDPDGFSEYRFEETN